MYEAVTGKTGWKNELAKTPFAYDLRSRFAGVLAPGAQDYLCSEQQELDDIVQFMKDWRD